MNFAQGYILMHFIVGITAYGLLRYNLHYHNMKRPDDGFLVRLLEISLCILLGLMSLVMIAFFFRKQGKQLKLGLRYQWG